MNPNSQGDLPRASVVVLTCGAPDVTTTCLESVARGKYRNLQLIVVSNGAGPAMTDTLQSLAQRLTSRGVQVQVLANATNVGACAGRNQALTLVEGRHVAFVDNDIVCRDPLWLNRAITLLESDDEVGAVGPRLARWDDPCRLECVGYAISPRGQVIPLAVGCPIERFREVRTVQAVGNFVARTATIRDIGGFDTAFDPFGFENIDCCYRIKQKGLKVVCDGQSDLHHVGHITTGHSDGGGKTMLFAKSLLLRKRWVSVFEAERSLFERLTADEQESVARGSE